MGSGGQKFADQSLLFLVFDAREEFLSEPGDCLWLVESLSSAFLGESDLYYLSAARNFLLSLHPETHVMTFSADLPSGALKV